MPKVLIITDSAFYLYNKLFYNLLPLLNNSGFKPLILIKDKKSDQDGKKFIHNLKPYEIIKYGTQFFKHYKGNSIQYGIKYLFYSFYYLRCMKQEIVEKINNVNPDFILTINSDDVSMRIIRKYTPSFSTYYLQHSNIKRYHKKYYNRKKLWNFIYEIFTGIHIYSKMLRPPFYDKEINYLLWSKSYFEERDYSDYNIKLIPKFHSEKLQLSSKKHYRNKIKNILIILNKKQNIGRPAWEEFSLFYIESLKGIDASVKFKIHPSETIEDVKTYFKKFEVIDGSINIDDYDLVISHWSTFIYDVAIHNKPFILVNPNNKYDYVERNLSEYPLFIYTPKDLLIMIEKLDSGIINHNSINRNFLNLHFPKGIVNNTQSIVDLFNKKLSIGN